MKFIDYIFKNLDIDYFINCLQNKPSDFNFDFVDLVLKSVWDTNSLKNRILPEYICKGTYYSINDTFHEKKNSDSPNVYSEYIKKNNKNLSDKNILSYFKNTEIRNTWFNYKYDLSNPLLALDDNQKYDFNDILQQYFIETVFFQKLKNFKVIGSFGPKEPSDIGKDFCMFAVYYEAKKISLIFKVYYNDSPNDSYECYFKKGEIHKKEILNFAGEYPDKNYYRPYLVQKDIHEYWKLKEFKKPYNLEIKTKYIPVKIQTYSEQEYFKKFKSNDRVSIDFIHQNPEKYFDNLPSTFKELNFLAKQISNKWDENPTIPLERHRLFHFLMTTKTGFRNNKEFINQIMYHCNDIEKFRSYLDTSILKDKSIMDELRILGLFRNQTKSFIKKVLNKNKDKLNDLAGNYLPKYLLNDPDIMMAIIKLNLDCMAHIGDKLKKNKSFMKKVNKLVKG